MNPFRVKNYAGRPVSYGLGFVWPLWAIAVAFLYDWMLAAVVVVVFALGFLDDMFGTGQSKGFKGHIRALLHGRLTTGSIKLFGISAVSFIYAFFRITIVGRAGLELLWASPYGVQPVVARVGGALLAGAAIALTSNAMNLMDLRPGRADKVYLLFITVGALLRKLLPLPNLCAYLDTRFFDIARFLSGDIWLVLLMMAPILVVMIPDLRERAMLGDAGANPAGLVAGVFIVSVLPLWGIAIYFVLVLLANAASEKVSFSTIIENNPLLKRIDNIGRLKTGEVVDEKE